MINHKAFPVLAFFFIQLLFGQDQKIADSLKMIYREGKTVGTEQLELLRNLCFNEISDLDLSLKYADELIELAKNENNQLYLHRGYLQKGNKYRLKGDVELALNAFFNCLEAARKEKYTVGVGVAYSSIADAYSVMGNSNNARSYYNKAISISRQTNDSIFLAAILLNAGDEYFKNQKYDSATLYFHESGIIFKKKDYLIGTAYNLGNLGMVYAEQDQDDRAEENITAAIEILTDLKDYYPISVYLTYMSDIYLKKNQWNAALKYAKRSLELAQKYMLKDQISEANLKLSELYEKTGNYKLSNEYYKNHIKYRDSVINLKAIEAMADLRTNYEVSQKQTEVDLLEKESQIQALKAKRQKNLIYAIAAGLVITFLFALGWFNRYRYVKKTNRIIEDEKQRADQLLNNILPEETAQELKESGKVKAKKFESVSVLFTDFQGFTQYADNLSPEILVESVGYYFSKFDEIMEKYGLEKIKTIGDSYMCAGGLPYPTPDHAKKTVQAALEIAEFVKDTSNKDAAHYTHFAIRIGINTGPVVAGVVGTKKFAYDIWGDTVNIASRMETNATTGRINISENTYDLIKDEFECEYRGEIEVRNKGMMKMYYVNKEVRSIEI